MPIQLTSLPRVRQAGQTATDHRASMIAYPLLSEIPMSENTPENLQALRDLVAMAQELETQHHLNALQTEFDQWRSGQINARELWKRLYDYLRGPSRELYSIYSSGSNGQIVARAIDLGILSKDDIPADVYTLLQDCNYLGRSEPA
jgi:hypothetical protein